MKTFVFILAMCSVAHADDLTDAISAQLNLPTNLGVAHVVVPAALSHAKPDDIIVEPPSTQLHPGRPSVKITWKKKTYYVQVSLSQMVDVAVTTHAIAAGSVITSDDISIEHRAIDGAGAPPAQMVGAVMNKDLDAGTAIGAHDVTLPAPSPRGTRVNVDIAHGTVHIKGSGVLEAATRVGEPASVRLAYNQTVLKGTLTSPGVVTVGE